MTEERSAGAVVFKREGGKIYYLLLLYNEGHWGLPKGKVEEGESDKDAAIREIKEETDIDVSNFEEGFEELIHYTYKRKSKKIYKTVLYFLTEYRKGKVTLSNEHVSYKWLKLNDSLDYINFDNLRRVVKNADNFLKEC